ncbi:MAG: tetratricopeptide repeat protein [Treponema sp.]|jgi:tetratricopeptide (TPR) repeat protein|nr:tetratricopeptide repeat protein [Treponema sp.]
MPSLQALREFKDSFSHIGDEPIIDDLELPGYEPTPSANSPNGAAPSARPSHAGNTPPSADELFGSDDISAGFTLDDLDDMDLNPAAADDTPADEPPAQPSDDIDFGAFLDTIPDDLAPPGGDGFNDIATPEPAAEEADDFSIPDGLLDGLSEDPESSDNDDLPNDDFSMDGLDSLGDLEPVETDAETPTEDLGGALDLSAGFEDLGGESTPETPTGDMPDFDLGNLDSLGDLEPADTEAPAEDSGGGLDLSAGFEDSGGGLDLSAGFEDLGDGLDLSAGFEDLGGESGAEPPAESTPETPTGDMPDFDMGNLDSLGDLEPAEDSGGDIDFSIPEDDGAGFDMGSEAGTTFDEAPAGDSFDSFSLGGDALDTDLGIDLDAGGEASPDGGMDEFSLPGIDDLFTGASPLDSAGPIPAAGARRKAAAASEEVEEIQLNDEELAKFQNTLAGYPLNLRIACEELIAEQAVAPDLMSKLVKLLIRGAPAKETAALAGKILGRTIEIPKGFEKSTGQALEEEQGSFAYIFVHNFLPVLRTFMMIAVVLASLGYLIYQFIYKPLHAESIYKIGLERLEAGEYQRANERFYEAFKVRKVKNWFYRYAEAFRDERAYLYAEGKYDELLNVYPRDKKGVLDYAAMETYYQRNYAKADQILRQNLLNYVPDDQEGLLALGDNSLAWGEIDKSKYEDARSSYARLLEKYGWTDPIVERMMKYFIRTDNLKEVLPLQAYFADAKKHKIGADSLSELGGYLLDKRLEEVRGVPNEYVEQIQGVRDLLLRAVKANPALPEPHYHLSRYYNSLGNTHEERITLETAIKAFDTAPEESIRRLSCQIDAQRRYANILRDNREFFPAEEQLIKGIGLYEDALSRRLLSRSPEYGKLYADLGDLEYFTKVGDMELALQYYRRSEQNGWAPPEMEYRMGSAYYYQENWKEALERFFTASAELPLNRRLLYALGNVSYQRGDYHAAQGYYNRLLNVLEAERSRLPLLMPNERPEFVELAERLMIARNNMGAVLEALTDRTGDNRYRSQAMAFYSESSRAWDSLTRDPVTMVRSSGTNLGFLNSRNALYPQPGYEPRIFIQIDKDVLEPSDWEQLAPQGGRLGE